LGVDWLIDQPRADGFDGSVCQSGPKFSMTGLDRLERKQRDRTVAARRSREVIISGAMK